jgi:hypothetical protein
MGLSEGDATECPEGYRRYVYRVRLHQSLKKRFREIDQPPQDLDQLAKEIGQALGAKEAFIRKGLWGTNLVIPLSGRSQVRAIHKRVFRNDQGVPESGVVFKERFREVDQPPQDLDQLAEEIGQALGVKNASIRKGLWGVEMVIPLSGRAQVRAIHRRIVGG